MNSIPKIISIVICFCLITGLCSVVYGTGLPSDADVETGANLDLFKTLGIIEQDFGFYDKAYVTKGEMAYICATLMGYKFTEATTRTFLDVAPTDKYAGAVEMLADCSVISGNGDGTFGIDKFVTAEEAVKMFVSVLGFDAKAKHSGGFPGGYLKVASDIKLLRGAEISEKLIKQSDIAKILDNVVEIEIPLFESVSSGNVEYSFEQGRTALTEYHHIYADSGVVTANSITALEGEALSAGYVYIDTFGKVYSPYMSADPFLGHSVDYYISDYEDKDKCKLLYMQDSDTNSIFTIDSDSLCLDNITIEEIGYYDSSDRVKRIRLSDDVKIVYNGVFERTVTPDMLKPQNGSLTLIDSDSDGKADVVSAENVTIAIVDGVDVENEKLWIRFSDEVMDLDSASHNVRVRNLREDMDLKYINSGDVITVATSRDGKAVSIVASNKTVSGTVDSYGEDEITIDGVPYKISYFYYELLQRNDVFVPEIKAGLSGTFYQDASGKIAYVTEGGTDGYLYAYLLDFYVDDSLVQKAWFKMFAQNGSILEAEASEKIRVHGNIIREKEDIYSYISEGADIKKQLVKIKLNEQGLVSELVTATETDRTIGYDLENFSHDFGIGSLQHRYGALGTKYRVGSQTIVFTIPEDVTDYDDYSIVDAASLLDSFVYDKVSVYDADENKIGRVVVFYDMQGGGGLDVALYQTKISVVDSVGTAIVSDDKETNVLHYYTDGVKKSSKVKNPDGKNIYSRYWRYDGIKVSDLKPGDIVQLRLDGAGEIETFHVLYRGEKNFAEYSSSGAPTVDWYTGALHTAYGVVKDKVSKRVTVNAHGDGSDINWDREFIIDGIPVYIWDKDARLHCTLGTIHDIDIGDKIFVKTINNSPREVVVYK